MGKKKVLHLISSLKIGGAETALFNYLSHPESEIFTHHVLFFHDGPFNEKIKKLGIKTQHITGPLHTFDPLAFYKTLRAIKKYNPSVIHASLWGSNIFARIIGKILSVPVISALHGKAQDEGNFRNQLDRLTASLAHIIVAVSNQTREAYENTIIKHAPVNKQASITQKLITINNGIDYHSLRLKSQNQITRASLGYSNDHFIIGSVGRLETIKSYDLLLQAFAVARKNNNTLKFCLIGDGSQRQHLQQVAHQLNIAHHVNFLGYQNSAPYYSLFDCFALSSQSEGLSIALLEALSFELPIITTHESMTHDVITHLKNGLIVPSQCPHAYARAITKLSSNSNLIKSIKAHNQERIKDFDLKTTVQSYNQLFSQH